MSCSVKNLGGGYEYIGEFANNSSIDTFYNTLVASGYRLFHFEVRDSYTDNLFRFMSSTIVSREELDVFYNIPNNGQSNICFPAVSRTSSVLYLDHRYSNPSFLTIDGGNTSAGYSAKLIVYGIL